MAKTNFVRSGD